MDEYRVEFIVRHAPFQEGDTFTVRTFAPDEKDAIKTARNFLRRHVKLDCTKVQVYADSSVDNGSPTE